MFELTVNYKKVKHFGLCAGWFEGETFALFQIALFEVNTDLKLIDLVRIKILKLSVDLYADWE